MKKLINLSLLLFTIHLSLIAISAQTEQKAEFVLQTGHSDDISAITFSPNGKLIASAAGDRTVKLWDAESGLQVKDFKLNNSPLFKPTDFARNDFNFGSDLMSKWIRNKTPLAEFLRSQLSSQTLNLFDKYDYEIPTAELLKSLASDMNRILTGELLYTPERFDGIRLSDETTALIERKPTGEELIKLN
jgi:WD40 repeat protein